MVQSSLQVSDYHRLHDKKGKKLEMRMNALNKVKVSWIVPRGSHSGWSYHYATAAYSYRIEWVKDAACSKAALVQTVVVVWPASLMTNRICLHRCCGEPGSRHHDGEAYSHLSSLLVTAQSQGVRREGSETHYRFVRR